MLRRIGVVRTLFEIALIAAVVVLAAKHPPASDVRWRDHIVCNVPAKEKVVALTYDDGPHPIYTPKLLDILDKYHAKATFFMVGRNMEKYPEIVKEVVRRGHVIGNHTFTHPRNIELDSRSQMVRELDECEEVIERLSGKRAYLFRPPRGLIDGTAFAIAEEEGYRTILWSVCADHHDAPTPELMAKRVLDRVGPGGIILAHDGRYQTRWKDVAATPLIIEALEKQGYRFVTIPELLKRR